jgi:DNA-binding winged helix-turn-helix (wHTH) protein/Tol biopolymer transport system component
MRISFGPFEFDRQSRLLWREGTEIALPPRVLGVLELLVDRAGQVVARQDLLDGVWKDAFVTDTSLAEAVSFLRQALGDDPQAPRYIQTVHRRGYRFLAPVEEAPRKTGTIPVAGPETGTVPVSEARVSWDLIPWSAALLCGGLALAALWWRARQPEPEAPPVARFELTPAPGTAFDDTSPSVAVSADGRTIAWSGCAMTSSRCSLYTRAIDRVEATPVAGTDGASQPFFSPDSRWIGFFADGKLKKIAASGGSATSLADAPAPGGGTWGPDGRIVFAGSSGSGLSAVPQDGGTITTVTTPRADRGEVRHLNPSFAPSGALLFTPAGTPLPDATGPLASLAPGAGDWTTVRSAVTRAVAAGPSYLLFSNGTDLQAGTFDPRTRTIAGTSESVLASAASARSVAQFAFGGGTLVAITGGDAGEARWSDGVAAPGAGRLSSIVVSPDARRAAGIIADAGASDVWVVDLAGNTLTRMTYGGVNVSPAWSADGTRLYFATRTPAGFRVASRAIDDRVVTTIGTGDAAHAFPSSISADGRIACTLVIAGGHTVAAIVKSGAAPQMLTAGPFDEGSPMFAPDARWVAMESTESGRTEIVVRDLREGRRVAVSADGGTQPRWSADGRALYFVEGRRLLRASFDPAGGVAGAPELVQSAATGRVLAVAASGRLLLRPQNAVRAFVTLQWLRELRDRLPQPVVAPR